MKPHTLTMGKKKRLGGRNSFWGETVKWENKWNELEKTRYSQSLRVSSPIFQDNRLQVIQVL
jgi:hypothetical protein